MSIYNSGPDSKTLYLGPYINEFVLPQNNNNKKEREKILLGLQIPNNLPLVHPSK